MTKVIQYLHRRAVALAGSALLYFLSTFTRSIKTDFSLENHEKSGPAECAPTKVR